MVGLRNVVAIAINCELLRNLAMAPNSLRIGTLAAWRNYLFTGRSKWITYIFLFVAMSIGIIFLVRRTALSSPAYMHATSFVRNSLCVKRSLGNIEDIQLGLFSTFYVKDNRSKWKLSVEGDKKGGVVEITLRRVRGQWSVTRATIHVDHRQVSCIPPIP